MGTPAGRGLGWQGRDNIEAAAGRIVAVSQVEAPGLGWIEVNSVSRRGNSMCKGPEARLPTECFHAHWITDPPPQEETSCLADEETES